MKTRPSSPLIALHQRPRFTGGGSRALLTATVAALGVAAHALGGCSSSGDPEAGTTEAAIGEANGVTLSCPGAPAFATIPSGGKRSFVGGLLRLEGRQCDSYGSCTPWTKQWDKPLTAVASAALDGASRAMSFGTAEAEKWSDPRDPHRAQEIEKVRAIATRIPIDAAGNGFIKVLGDGSYGGVEYGRERSYPGGSSHFRRAVMDPMSMAVRVGSTCALLVQQNRNDEYVFNGMASWLPRPAGWTYRLVLQLELEKPGVPASGGAADAGATVPAGRCDDQAPRVGDDAHEACQKCCATAHATGMSTVYRAQQQCFCKASTCGGACAATACAADPVSADSACNACLQAKDAACQPEWQTACAADPDCVALAACYDTCR